MPSLRHASPRRPRRGAQRRARRRRDREAPWHAPGRGRSRAAAAQLRWDGGKHGADRLPRHRPVPPLCVTRTTPSPANGYGCGDGPRLAQFRPGFLRPLQLQRKVRYDGIHRPYFSAVFRGRPPDLRAFPARGGSGAVLHPRRDRRAAVRRRPPPDRYRFDHPRPGRSVGGPDPPRAASDLLFQTLPGQPRFPGFSQVSQVPPRYLLRCTSRYVNAVTQINFSK